MLNQKLLEIIGSLFEKKCQCLSLFVEFDYYNDCFNRVKFIKLCEILVVYVKEGMLVDLEKVQFSKIFFFDYIYIEKDKNLIDLLVFDFFSLICDFLLVEGVFM